MGPVKCHHSEEFAKVENFVCKLCKQKHTFNLFSNNKVVTYASIDILNISYLASYNNYIATANKLKVKPESPPPPQITSVSLDWLPTLPLPETTREVTAISSTVVVCLPCTAIQ